MLYRFTVLLTCLLIFSCTQKTYVKKIDRYLNASTVEAKGKLMAPGYHSFFAEKKGEGENKTAALKSFMEWDGPLHPDVKILSYSLSNDVWTVQFNEQNDFSKLVGYPGWKGKGLFRFGPKKQLIEFVYLPDSTNPSYGPYLKPAVDWLQANRPKELAEVYQKKRLIQTNASALQWVVLLQAWRAQTK
jgi:hypothetical protein